MARCYTWQAALFDVQTGEELQTFAGRGNEARYTPVGVSADGTHIALADGSLFQIWDAATGRVVRERSGSGGWSWAQLDGRGNLIISAEAADFLEVMPLAPSEPVRRITLPRDGYRRMFLDATAGIALLRQGRYSVVVDLAAEAVRFEIPGYFGSGIKTVTFSPDHSLIALGRSYGRVLIVDAQSGEIVGDALVHNAELQALDFAPDGSTIASAETYGLRIWSLDTALQGNIPARARLCIDADTPGGYEPGLAAIGTDLVFSNGTDQLQRLDPAGGEVTPWGPPFADRVRAVQLDDTGGFLFAELDRANVEVRRAADGSLVSTLGPHSARFRDVVVGPEGARVITLDRRGVAGLWDVESGDLLFAINNEDINIASAALSPDGALAAFAFGIRVAIFNAEDGTFITQWRLPDEREAIRIVEFSGDEELALIYADRNIQFINAVTGASRTRYGTGAENQADVITLSPDGTTFLYDDDEHVFVRDLATGEVLAQLTHAVTVSTARFDQTGERILTAVGDGTVALWDVSQQAPIARFAEHRGIMENAIFLADGQIASAGIIGQVCLFDGPGE